MRLRVRHLCLAVVPVAVLLAFSMRSDDDRHYCLGCGLLKLSKSRTLLGISVPGPIRY